MVVLPCVFMSLQWLRPAPKVRNNTGFSPHRGQNQWPQWNTAWTLLTSYRTYSRPDLSHIGDKLFLRSYSSEKQTVATEQFPPRAAEPLLHWAKNCGGFDSSKPPQGYIYWAHETNLPNNGFFFSAAGQIRFKYFRITAVGYLLFSNLPNIFFE